MTIDAGISSISHSGVVVVAFDYNLTIPNDYSSFDSSILQIDTIPGSESTQSDLAFTWAVTDFTNLTMTIQLTFVKP